MEKVKMRSCERKSIARYRGEFADSAAVGHCKRPLRLARVQTGPVHHGVVLRHFAGDGFGPQPHGACTIRCVHDFGGLLAASTAPVIIPQEMKEALEKDIKGLRESLGTFTEDAQKQIKATGTMAEETKGKIDKTLTEIGDFKTRLKDVEDHITKSKTLGADGALQKSLGQVVIESEQFKEFSAKRHKASGKIEVPSFGKTAIVNATGLNQPLVPQVRVPGIFDPLVARLTVRDLLNTVPTVGNLIPSSKRAPKPARLLRRVLALRRRYMRTSPRRNRRSHSRCRTNRCRLWRTGSLHRCKCSMTLLSWRVISMDA
jgi:hypothetical protein